MFRILKGDTKPKELSLKQREMFWAYKHEQQERLLATGQLRIKQNHDGYWYGLLSDKVLVEPVSPKKRIVSAPVVGG